MSNTGFFVKENLQGQILNSLFRVKNIASNFHAIFMDNFSKYDISISDIRSKGELIEKIILHLGKDQAEQVAKNINFFADATKFE